MLTQFLFITLLYLLGSAGLIHLLWVSIQSGQWIDLLFKWQDMLDVLYLKSRKNKWVLVPYKWLGGCKICFTNFITLVLYIAYVIGWVHIGGYWVTGSISNSLLWFSANVAWVLIIHMGIGVTIALVVSAILDKRDSNDKPNEIVIGETTLKRIEK